MNLLQYVLEKNNLVGKELFLLINTKHFNYAIELNEGWYIVEEDTDVNKMVIYNIINGSADDITFPGMDEIALINDDKYEMVGSYYENGKAGVEVIYKDGSEIYFLYEDLEWDDDLADKIKEMEENKGLKIYNESKKKKLFSWDDHGPMDYDCPGG